MRGLAVVSIAFAWPCASPAPPARPLAPTGTDWAAVDAAAFAPSADAETRAERRSFRRLKELIFRGFYLSRIGATEELRFELVPGEFRGCVPLAEVGRTWAT